MTPIVVWRAAWKDGWVAAWMAVTAFNLAMGAFALTSPWVAGAFFGGTIGMLGGYVVTMQRNYRRTWREMLEWQLEDLKKMELRMIARGDQLALEHVREGQEQLAKALERVS